MYSKQSNKQNFLNLGHTISNTLIYKTINPETRDKYIDILHKIKVNSTLEKFHLDKVKGKIRVAAER